jgi:pimeloyl-ACP methyl ester carboxylesterase
VKARTVETRRGVRGRLLEAGSGAPVLFLHGAGGLLRENPFLDALARRFAVVAPEWPGYGEGAGEERLEDMLDFALHGWDLVDALGLGRPHLIGHSMGGMIAAEMACLAPRDLGRLVLAAPAGLWLDTHPVPDVFAFLPHEFADVLFHDPARGQALLTGGLDLSDMEALKTFYLANQRRMAMAGKILYPIPNRRLSRRLYRLSAPTLLLWGASDRLMGMPYAERWQALIPHARLEVVAEAGHMLPYEQPEAFAAAATAFLESGA